MDEYQFIASLVSSLAWPASAGAIAVVLRRPLRAVLGRVTSFKGGGVELTIAEEAGKIADQVEATQVLLPAPTPDVPGEDIANRSDGGTEGATAQTADDDLAAAEEGLSDSAIGRILGAWLRMERRIERLLGGWGYENVRGRAVRSLARAHRDGRIPMHILESVVDLYGLRNRVAHGRTKASNVDADAYERATFDVGRAIDEHARGAGSGVAEAIRGQGQLATMSYDELVQHLKQTFPDLRSPG